MARQGHEWPGAYPDGEDERPEEAAEGPGRAGRSLLFPLWGGEASARGRCLRRLGVGVAKLLLPLAGLWFPGCFSEATSLLNTVTPSVDEGTEA